jgi:negative regulator of sigma E activity
MFERMKSRTAVATAASLVAALGVGGVAVAQNSSNATPTQKANPVTKVQGQQKSAQENSATDSDNVQSGDQSAPDKGGADSETNDASSEQPGTETNDSGEQPGSEVSNNDGPGGHADEPGNANADHQAQGQE